MLELLRKLHQTMLHQSFKLEQIESNYNGGKPFGREFLVFDSIQKVDLDHFKQSCTLCSKEIELPPKTKPCVWLIPANHCYGIQTFHNGLTNMFGTSETVYYCFQHHWPNRWHYWR